MPLTDAEMEKLKANPKLFKLWERGILTDDEVRVKMAQG
jgi:hypothetical protein